MTNKEIINYIYENINIQAFIRKVISTSYLDHSYKDLEQYIYLYLLEYDNEKLNNLYEQKVLKQFIMRIILNQRNYYMSNYNKYLRIFDKEIIEEYKDEEPDLESKKKLEFINKEIKKYVGKRKGLTEEKEYEMFCYQLYKIYLDPKRDMTLRKLSIRMKVSIGTITKMINFAKQQIKNNYDKYGNN